MNFKHVPLLALTMLLCGVSYAQDTRPISREDARAVGSINRWYMNQLMQEMGSLTGPVYRAAPISRHELNDQAQELGKTSTASAFQIARATNAFTILRGSQNQVVADNALNMVGFIHRQNVDDLGTGGSPATTSNGISRMTLSTNGGSSFMQNIGPLNPVPYGTTGQANYPNPPIPLTARGRYPQVAYHRPGGTTNIDEVQFAWVSPTTDGSNWGNYMWGNAFNVTGLNLRNDPPRESDYRSEDIKYSSLGASQEMGVLLPGGLCEGRPGEFWTYDVEFVPTGGSGGNVRRETKLFKGVFNPATDSVEWAQHRTFRPPYRLRNNGNPMWATTPNMDFGGPNNEHGWVVLPAMLNDPRRPDDSAINFTLYRTTNGGDSWQGPINVFLNDYEAITDSLRRTYVSEDTTFSSTGIALAFSYDIKVDGKGNPHILAEIVNASDSSYVDGTMDTEQSSYTFAPGLYKGLYDITTYDGGNTWEPKFVAELTKYSGTIPGTSLTFDTRPQIASSEDGEYMFYSWADDTVSTRDSRQMRPNPWHSAQRLSDEAMIPAKRVIPAQASIGQIYFPSLPTTVLDSMSGGTRLFAIPTVYMRELEGSENLPADFMYMRGRDVLETEFTPPTRDIEITDITAPVQNICQTGAEEVTINVRNNGTSAIDSFSVTYYVEGNQFGSWRRIQDNTPLPAGQSRDITFSATAGVDTSGAVDGRLQLPNAGSFIIRARVSAPNEYVLENNSKQRTVVVTGESGTVLSLDAVADCGEVTINTGLQEVGGATITAEWFEETATPDVFETDPIVDGGAIELIEDGRSLRFAPPTSTDPQVKRFRIQVTNSVCGTPVDDTITVTINPVPSVNLQVREGDGTYTDISAVPDVVTPVNGKYQVCGQNGNRLWIQAADTSDADKENYVATWYQGPVASGTPFSSKNFLSVTQPGPYTLLLRDTVTGCEIDTTFEFRVWDINLDLSGFPENVCIHRESVLDASNETTGNFGDVLYNFTVEPQSLTVAGQTFAGDDTTVSRVNVTNPNQGLLWPNEAENVFMNTRRALYTVAAQHQDADIVDCGAANISTATRTITTWDTVDVQMDSNLPLFGNVPNDFEVVLTNNSNALNTPVTHMYWTIAPLSRFEILEGTLGSPTVNGSETIRFRIREQFWLTPGNRRIELIACSAPETSTTPATDGCCDTLEITYGGQAVVSRTGADLASRLTVYPNPTSGAFDLMGSFDQSTALRLELMDTKGRVISRQELRANAEFVHKIDLSNEANGIYLLKVQTANGLAVKRIGKQ